MITYNDIYEALRKEKYSEQLQPLAKNFIDDVLGYLKEKKELSERKDDVFSDTLIKTKKQFENAVSIFKELMRRRRKKLLDLAFIAKETGISKRDFENMLDFEREMFDKLVGSLEEADKKVIDLMSEEKKEENYVLITFKDNVEEFLDLNGERIGPFDKGEIANLPEEIVKILIEAGKVEVMED